MTYFLKALTISTVLLSPAALAAQSLSCPDVGSVFARDNATESPLSIDQLSKMIGNAEVQGRDLHSAANSLRVDYPEASNAEIADIMVTVYCNYLLNDAPESHRTEANMVAFEQEAYAAVYGPDTPPTQAAKVGFLSKRGSFGLASIAAAVHDPSNVSLSRS